MRFINRVSDYPNKKILHVSHASYSNGELSELHVTEEKDEGTVTVVGTELNAENLNKAVEEFGRNRFLCIYLREMFGLIIDEDDFSFDLDGNNSSKTVVHPAIRKFFKPYKNFSFLFSFSIINLSNSFINKET